VSFVLPALLTLALLADDPAVPPGIRGELPPLRGERTEPDLGMSAPLVAVDRFSDPAASLFRRGRDPRLPAPGVKFSLDDAPFLLSLRGPDGAEGRCYALDLHPDRPARMYVFYDQVGNYHLAQFPVVDVVPGMPGYNDLWDVWKVVTPDGFKESNWLRDAATVEKLLADPASGYTAASTGVLVNHPIVPEGTAASMKADGKSGEAVRKFAWFRGSRAPFLFFEGSLKPGEGGTVRVMTLTAGDRSWPPAAPLRAEAMPGQPAYSPLVRVVDASGRPVVDGLLNCPMVGTRR